MISLRLKEISSCDFRKSELTNYKDFLARKKGKFKLREGEVVCLVSNNEQQIIFVFAPETEEMIYYQLPSSRKYKHPKQSALVIRSIRFRIDHGHWNPLMLQNYAQRVGIKLIGLNSFEDHYKDIWQKNQRKK